MSKFLLVRLFSGKTMCVIKSDGKKGYVLILKFREILFRQPYNLILEHFNTKRFICFSEKKKTFIIIWKNFDKKKHLNS